MKQKQDKTNNQNSDQLDVLCELLGMQNEQLPVLCLTTKFEGCLTQ